MQKQSLFAAMLLTFAGTGLLLTCSSAQTLPKRADVPNVSPFGGGPSTIDREFQARMNALSRQSKAHYDAASALRKQGSLGKAERECLEGLRIMQSWPDFTGQQLLGEIYLQGGQSEKALHCFQTASRFTRNTSLPLDAALAYCQMGDYEHARQFHPDASILAYKIGGKSLDSADLPGTDTLNDLRASLLLARGMDASSECDYEEAITNLQSADKYAPSNPLVHYFWGESLLHDATMGHQDRTAEAIPHYEVAARRSHGVLLSHLQKRLFYARGRLDNIRAFNSRQAKRQAGQTTAQYKTGP